MRLKTLIERAQHYLPAADQREPAEKYPDVEVGYEVEWRHQNKTLQGVVIHLLDRGTDSATVKPRHIPKRNWRASRDWKGYKRVIVEVMQPDGTPLYYVVNYSNIPAVWRHTRFRVMT